LSDTGRGSCPLRRFRQGVGGPRSVAESDLPSLEVTAPCRGHYLEALAPLLVRCSPLALSHFGTGFRVFAFPRPRDTLDVLPRAPLLGFGSSSEDAQAPSRRIEALASQILDARRNPRAILQRLP